MSEPDKQPGFFEKFKFHIVCAVIVGVVSYGIKLYGDARYMAGKLEVQTFNANASTEALLKLQAAADEVTRSSNAAAQQLAAREDSVRQSTEQILQAIQNKPLATVNTITGDCAPTNTFITTWNKLNSTLDSRP